MNEEKIQAESEETEDYPRFIVCDDRVTGSITMSHSRLPLWAVIQNIVDAGYKAAVRSHPTIVDYVTADQIGWFLYDLLENRKDFRRLLCVLADVERQEREAKWNEFGRDAVYLLKGTPTVREEVAPMIAGLGLGPIVEEGPGNLHPVLRMWYADPAHVARVREALLSALKHLEDLQAHAAATDADSR